MESLFARACIRRRHTAAAWRTHAPTHALKRCHMAACNGRPAPREGGGRESPTYPHRHGRASHWLSQSGTRGEREQCHSESVATSPSANTRTNRGRAPLVAMCSALWAVKPVERLLHFKRAPADHISFLSPHRESPACSFQIGRRRCCCAR